MTPPTRTVPTLTLNGRDVPLRPGADLLTTCLEAGVEVPHFCWHPALGSVGACRMCAVTVTDPGAAPRLEMACMCAAREGQTVTTADPDSARFRDRVVEWLMLNHPHDCAVCEEGGACHLQDVTAASAHLTRRYHGPKRRLPNQDLGPFLKHEISRCIGCYRCTRFYRDHAGGRDLEAFGSHDRLWFGRAEPGPLDSPFAGNLAEVCPTGVFVDRGLSDNFARKWDLAHTPSVCTQCPLGCNITLGAKSGRIRVATNRYHGALNGWFLCDRGRFGALWSESPARLRAPLLNGAPADPAQALAAARALVAQRPIGLGSPRASVEANAMLRALVGPDRFFAGTSDAEHALTQRLAAILRETPHQTATLKDFETADAALVLAEDLTGAAPRAALALRQMTRGAERALAAEKSVDDFLDAAVRTAGEGRRSPLALVTPLPDPLDPVATWSLRRTPEAAATLAHTIRAALTAPTGDPEADAIAAALRTAKRPLIIAGATQSCPETVEAALALARALGPHARLALFPPEANSLGLALLSPRGGAETAAAQNPPAVIVLENDLSERLAPATIETLAAAPWLVLDALATATTQSAAVALPTAAPTEAAGTWINYEGRAQRTFAALPPAETPPAAWRRLRDLAEPRPLGDPQSLDALLAALAAADPALHALRDAAPGAEAPPVARLPLTAAGRTAHDLAGRVPQGTTPADPDSPLRFSMEGAHGPAVPPALAVGDPGVPGHRAPGFAYRLQTRINGPLIGGDPGSFPFRRQTATEAPLAPSSSANPEAARPTLAQSGEDARQPLAKPGEDARHLLANGGGFARQPLAKGGEDARQPLRRVTLSDPFAAAETDRAAPRLAARAPGPRLVLNPADALARDITEGAQVLVNERLYPARASLDASLPEGLIALSPGPWSPRGAPLEVHVRPAP